MNCSNNIPKAHDYNRSIQQKHSDGVWVTLELFCSQARVAGTKRCSTWVSVP